MIPNQYQYTQNPNYIPHNYSQIPIQTSRVLPYSNHQISSYPFASQYNNHQQLTHMAPKRQSRIEYIPYEIKYIQYQSKQYSDRVPVQRTVIDYRQVKKIEYVPKERTVTDYYAVQYQTSYIPQTIPERVLEYVPVQRISERIQYIPVEKQVVHYPSQALRNSGNKIINSEVIRNQGHSKMLSNVELNEIGRSSSNIYGKQIPGYYTRNELLSKQYKLEDYRQNIKGGNSNSYLNTTANNYDRNSLSRSKYD